jgi:glutamate/tyrosine decarboxylase-like PLP-dependent enzyme
MHQAWVHVDGAFGLWARVLDEKNDLTHGLERADSWSVDGHKWLQTPYECGFAIVKNRDAHIRAMSTSAGYLSEGLDDGRNPNHFGPELSRRARGFAVWAVLRAFGRKGVERVVRENCLAAQQFAGFAASLKGLRVLNSVSLNQVSLDAEGVTDGAKIQMLEQRMNDRSKVFVRSASWKGRKVLRFSFVTPNPSPTATQIICEELRCAWTSLGNHNRREVPELPELI